MQLLDEKLTASKVPYYEGEAAYAIFHRSLFNKDIATGIFPVFDELTTIGPSSTFQFKNDPPEFLAPKCYILNPGTCTQDVYATVLDGTAIVKDYFVVGNVKDEVSEAAVNSFVPGAQQQILGGKY